MGKSYKSVQKKSQKSTKKMPKKKSYVMGKFKVC